MAEINYQARDFESTKQSLIEYCRQEYKDWTDLNESEQGIILIELFAYINDVQNRYIDRQADEVDIDKLQNRGSMISLMKIIGYKLKGATAATVDQEISIEDGALATGNVPIPQGFRFYTRDARNPIIYEVLDAGQQIAVGQNKVTVKATQGETQTQYATLQGGEDQFIRLEMTPYLEGFTTISIDGADWTEVENLLDSTSTDRHFYVEVEDSDTAIIRFGNGAAGAQPIGQAEITYRTGGGAAGRVGPNTLTVPESPQLLDENGTPVTITCTNPSSSIGGDDKESIENARVAGPNSRKANMRTVHSTDFVLHSEEVPGVARAFVRFRKDDPTIPQNIARLQIVPDGGGNPNQALKDSVKDYLYNEKPVQDTLVVDPIDPKYKAVNVTFTAIPMPGVEQTDLDTRTAAAIQAFLLDFDAKDVTDHYILDWGATIYPDDLAIKVDGCRSIRITSPTEPVVCAADEFPAPGTIGVTA